MKQKVLSRWLILVLPLVAAAYLFYPTYEYYQLDNERSALKSDSAALDEWDRNNEKAFDAAKAGRLKLGLDLRGGMYVTLEVDVLKLIEESALPEAVDDQFLAIVEQTRKATDNTDKDVLQTFLDIFRKDPKRSLLEYFTVSNQLDVTEEAVVTKLQKDVSDAIDQALQVIKQRINKFEVSEVSIQKIGSRRIQIELPDVKDEGEIRKLLQTTARLEFTRVLNGPRLIETALNIDKILKGMSIEEPVADTASGAAADSAKNLAQADSTADSAKVDSAGKRNADTADPYAGLSEEERARRVRADYPFTWMISGSYAADERSQPQQFGIAGAKLDGFPKTGIYNFYVGAREVPKLLALLDRPEVKKAMPVDLMILVGATAEGPKDLPESEKFYYVYAVAAEPELTGDAITEAYPSFDPTNNSPMVMMQMDANGAERWAQITGANVGKRIAIVLDGRVYSAPNVLGKIPNGSSQITGSGNIEEATLLAVVLKAGALKAPVKIIEERVVGPSLGEDSIRRGITSSVISFALVIVFMLLYYAIGGALADIALLVNVLLVVAALIGFNGTLSLPGIAGIILSTAMAVDANILVFERMREEFAAGRNLRSAVQQGYEKAWSAIFDSNITNMLSGVVLLFLGTGPVKGFAVTLIIGVIMTLFTAVVMTRAMFELIIASGATTINLGQKKQA
ncbi:MAG: protein translocase subunit SecD [Candidatus Kapabacteria bacterium]|nr:protein translocase subunit SecD [Candidatus Kapabacteria bacterium]